MRRPLIATVVLAGLAVTSLGAAPTKPLDDAQAPLDTAIDAVGTELGACDDLDERLCLFPFPNDHFTAVDETTPTGRRVDLSPLATPRNVAGKPMDPTEWNRNDGFSPGTMALTVVPDLDLTTTFGLDETPETGPGGSQADEDFPVRDGDPDHLLEAPELAMAPDAPIVLLDADTGERHPYWAELDEHVETLADGEDRTLIIRPLTNLREGHRYVVALRDLRDGDGQELPAPAAFAALRDGWEPPAPPEAETPPCDDHPGKGNGKGKGKQQWCRDGGSTPPPGPSFPEPVDIDPADRDARYDDIFTRLHATGVAVSDLHLAWDFHVASGENLAGRALAIRDDAFAQLGDDDLANLVVDGDAPPMEVTEVIDREDRGNPTRIVRGTVTVPNYLHTPQDELVDGAPVVIPQSRFLYEPAVDGAVDRDTPVPGAMATPIQNPVVPTTDAEFTCHFRTDVDGLRPTLYGHGLLGSKGEGEGSSSADLREAGHAMCAVDWIGMATEDITNVGLILHDISFFPSLADRAQQGFLNFMYVGRALLHADGASAHAAFQDEEGTPRFDTSELFYNGNSQGGIMGGALTALAPDFTKSVLGVPGINYSTLLNRSVDWEGEFLDPTDPGLPAYASFHYNAYPDKVEQQLNFALLQMLWDRAEGNGYAQHMTDDPYPNTPAHQVLLEVAFGDYQVTNHAAEVQARTIGADYLQTALAPGRHWERDVAASPATEVPYGLTGFSPDEDGRLFAPGGSALVYWDSGNPTPPNGNVPPAYLGQDPHSDPRKDPDALRQKVHFYTHGDVVDVLDGQPYWTYKCPRHPEQNPGCPVPPES